MTVCDTDIVSAFGKANAISPLIRLFRRLYIPPSVYHELMRAKYIGYDFVDVILDKTEILMLNPTEFEEFRRILENEKSLHEGEIQGIVLCKYRGEVFLTNDKEAKKYCDGIGVEHLDLEEILRALRRLLSKDELKTLIEELEVKDRIIIKAKDEILK